MSKPLPSDLSLHRTILFSRRIGNYLYLPFFVVCLVALLLALEELSLGFSFWQNQRGFGFGLIVVGMSSFALWRLSRRPRPLKFLVEGLVISLLLVAWIGTLIFGMLYGEPNWRRTNLILGVVGLVGSFLWFLFASYGMFRGAQSCFRMWRELKQMDQRELRGALDRVLSQPPAFLETLDKAPVRSVSFAGGTIDLLPSSQIEPAPEEEIEAGRWKDEWVVIAVEGPDGKPIYIDTAEAAYPVYLARPELDAWHQSRIADSLSGFLDSLAKVHRGGGEEPSMALKNRMLPDEGEERIVTEIQAENPRAEMWFWKRLLIPPET